MILNLVTTNPVFSCAADINKTLVRLFGQADPLDTEKPQLSSVVIAMTRFTNEQATEAINTYNSAQYAKKVCVSKMWVDVRGDVRKESSVSFPFMLKHTLYKPHAEFIESIPDKHKKLILIHDEQDYTVLNMIEEMIACANSYSCKVYGVYREEASCDETSERPNQTRKVLHLIIAGEELNPSISAAITINFFIVEGKHQ